MDAATIVRAGVDDLDEVRAVRLCALADSPWAFGSTLAREEAFDQHDWIVRLTGGPWWVARRAGRTVGLVAAYADDEPGTPVASAQVVSMWVESSERGRGTGAALVDAVISWAAAGGLDQLTLWVADGNQTARRLYERCGFETTGVRQPLPSDPMVGEEELVRVLAPRPPR